MHDLTGFQRDCLFVAAGFEEPHGLAIKEELEEYREGEVNHASLYTGLDTLAEKGLIKKEEIDSRTNAYLLTERGERELEARRAWQSQYVDFD